MPYEIVFDADSGEIVAVSAGAAPGERLVLGAGRRRAFADLDLAARPVDGYRIDPETEEVQEREDWSALESEAVLDVSVDIADRSEVDPSAIELPADGATVATITVRKRSMDTGRVLTGAPNNNQVTVRTTAGTLSTRRFRLRSGSAKFTLRSSTETVTAEVRVSVAGFAGEVPLRFEFAPVA